MNHKIKFVLTLFAMLVFSLSACGPKTKFVAPEIEPPADLIPGYVPEGFELIKGYQISMGDFEASRYFVDAEDYDEDTCFVCDLDLPESFFDMQSPAGNDILGIHYQDGNSLLLVTKSYYPGGNLELWRAAYEASDEGTQDCDCFIFRVRSPDPLRLRRAEIQEVRTVGETQVAVLDGTMGLVTVFVRGDYLLTVESDISLEENLKVVASILDD